MTNPLNTCTFNSDYIQADNFNDYKIGDDIVIQFLIVMYLIALFEWETSYIDKQISNNGTTHYKYSVCFVNIFQTIEINHAMNVRN